METQSLAHPAPEQIAPLPAAPTGSQEFNSADLESTLMWMGETWPYNIRMTKPCDRLIRPAGNMKGDIAKHLIAAVMHPDHRGKIKPIAFGAKTESTTARLPKKLMERLFMEAKAHHVNVCDVICTYIVALHGKLDNPAYNGSKPSKPKATAKPAAKVKARAKSEGKISKLGSQPQEKPLF